MSGVTVEVSQKIATITLNRPKTLNALTHEGTSPPNLFSSSPSLTRVTDYTAFSEALRSIDKRDDVVATVWRGASNVTVPGVFAHRA